MKQFSEKFHGRAVLKPVTGSWGRMIALLKKEDVAAVFMEPIQGEGGINLPDPQFLASVREATSSFFNSARTLS